MHNADRPTRRRIDQPRDAYLLTLGTRHDVARGQDRAADAGVAVPQGAGRSEIAEALGTAPARWAAEQVDRAVFSPTGIGEADAEWVWVAAEADRQERREGLTRWQRLREAYALRSYGVEFRAKRTDRAESATTDAADASRPE